MLNSARWLAVKGIADRAQRAQALRSTYGRRFGQGVAMNVPMEKKADTGNVVPGACSLLAARFAWWVHEKSLTARFAVAVALLVFLALAALTETLSRSRNAEFVSERNAAMLAFASELRARADRELNSVLFLGSGLVGYLVVRHDALDPGEVERILAAVYANSRHIRNFSVAVGYLVRFVYPLAGNEAIIGRDYRELPAQWPAVKRAIESRAVVLTGPVTLVQGGSGLIYRTPIFVGGSYWGMLSSVIDMQSFQQAAFGEIVSDRYAFAVRAVEHGSRAGVLLLGDGALFDDPSAVRIDAQVPNGVWSYAVRDKRPSRPASVAAIRAIGWLLAALAGLGVGLVLRQRRALAQHAGNDSLTGLPNRRLFDDRLEQALRRHARDQSAQIAMLFMDLDGFKPINDRYGHKTGDAVLCHVATRIRDELRAGDTVARWAGDEFAVLVEGADDAQLDQLLGRLRQCIAAPMHIGPLALSVGVSIGMARYPDEASDGAALVELADRRMYIDKVAKNTG